MQFEFPLDLDITEDTAHAAQSVAQFIADREQNLLVIAGQSYSKHYCHDLLERAGVTPATLIDVQENSVARVYEVERTLRTRSLQYILAVGGGRVADFAKRLAYIGNLPLLLVPTIIANDGLISTVAVLLDEGYSVSLPGKMPSEVVIDLSTIRQAPDRYLIAAACDIVSNLSATNDWERVQAGESARLDHLALHMSRMAAFGVLDCRSWDIKSDAFLRSIVFGQILSGVAMAISGSSRPCSGSEHLICHALDHLSIGTEILHGKKVGITSRFCLYLQDAYSELIEEFFAQFHIFREFPGCSDATSKDLENIFSAARRMRPGRATILDRFSDAELARRYFVFDEQEEKTSS